MLIIIHCLGSRFIVGGWMLVLLTGYDLYSVLQSLGEFPSFNGSRSFTTPSTRAVYLPLICIRLNHSVRLHFVSLKSILILSGRLVILLLVNLFNLDFPPISYMYSCSLHSCYMSCSSQSFPLHHFNYTHEEYKLLVKQFSPRYRHFILLGPKYSPYPALKSPSLGSSLNV
jgi:hypothetical protein